MKLERDEPHRGWVFYDGECSFCTAAATRFAPLLRRHDFRCLPLQTPWVQERLHLKPGELLLEMKLLTAGGKVFGGAEALLQIARNIWWAWPLFVFSFLPGIKFFLDLAYRQVAARRNCLGGQCAFKKGTP
jgi:predicted DCC family thiol-disulfide oxidoreductase YuxK